MTVHDVKATIRSGNTFAEESSKMLRQVKDRLTETAILAHETLHNSHDQDVDAGLQLLVRVERTLDETIEILREAVGHAETFTRDLG